VIAQTAVIQIAVPIARRETAMHIHRPFRVEVAENRPRPRLPRRQNAGNVGAIGGG
jgi:hypothetical protein